MKSLITAVLICLATSSSFARTSTLFDEWWYSGSAVANIDLVISNYYSLTLTTPTTWNTLVATNGGMLYANMNAETNLSVSSTPSPTNINGIAPWITLDRTEGGYFTTNWGYYTSGKIYPYRNYNTATAPASWSATDNVRPSGTIANSGLSAKTINSLVLDQATPFAANDTKFTLTSGGLTILQQIPYIAAGARATSFSFPNRGYIWLSEGTQSYISMPSGTTTCDGTNGIVVTGHGNSQLTQLLFDTYGISGNAYINQSGNIWLNNGAHFGMAGSSVNTLGTGDCTYYLQGGTLVVGSDGNINYNRPLVFRDSNSVVTAYTYLGGSGEQTKTFRSLSVECCTATFEGWGATQVLGKPANRIAIKNPVTLLQDTKIVSRVASEGIANITYFSTAFLDAISGPYALELGGDQRIELRGTNTYTGLTTLTNTVTTYLYSNSNLVDTAGLNFANYGTSSKLNIATGLNVPVNKLYFRGTEQLSGTFGSASSAATYKDSTRFAGTGILTVTNGPAAPTQWDVVLGIGQSNMNGMGNLTNSPVTVYGAAQQTSNGTAFAQLVDPTGVIFGSCVPAFANEWFRQTGRGVVYVYGGGYAGSSLIPAAEPTTGYNWTKGNGYLYTNAVAQMNGAIAAFGGTIANKVVLWIQGEQDASLVNGTTITGPIYQSALMFLIANLNADITGGIDSFRVSELGAFVDGSYASECAEIRLAQTNAVASFPYASMPFTGAKDFVARGMMVDNVHYDSTGLNEVGAGLATNPIP